MILQGVLLPVALHNHSGSGRCFPVMANLMAQVEFASGEPGAKTSGQLIFHSENIEKLD